MTQASETLGKTAGKDLHHNKPTYVSRARPGRRARAMPRELRDQAHAALARSGLADAARLSLLADQIVERDS